MYKVTIERDLDLESVFVTAIEGGSNYWCCFGDDSYDLVRSAVPKTEDECFSTALYKAVVERGVVVPVYDAEDPDEELGVLDVSLFQQRLGELSKDEGCKWALENECDENGDSSSSDVVFQYLIMGEVVYG